MENNINRIIRNRRSIYPHEFSGAELNTELIETLLENANYAPNHKSNYPWRFLVMKGESLRTFIETAAEIYRTETDPALYREEKYIKILEYRSKVSHVIAIVLHREAASKTILNEDICAVAAAVQNMYLSLSQFPNAGGYWSTGLGTYSRTMHAHLNLAEGNQLLGFFVLGFVEHKREEGRKKPWQEFVKFT